MMHISEDSFYWGLHQATFFHDIPVEDSRYDIEKDVVGRKLVSINGGADKVMKEVDGDGENATPRNEPEPSFEELFEPLWSNISWSQDVGLNNV